MQFRKVFMVVAGGLILMLSGCSQDTSMSSNPTREDVISTSPSNSATMTVATPTSRPEAITTCEAVNPNDWSALPSNMRIPNTAAALGVNLDALDNATLGNAMCKGGIEINAIGSTNPPIVEIKINATPTTAGLSALSTALSPTPRPRKSWWPASVPGSKANVDTVASCE